MVGALSSVGLPIVAVAAIVVAVWYVRGHRSSPASKPAAGTGVIALDAARNHTGEPPAPERGRAAPDFRRSALADGGNGIRLCEFQGKTVLVNFWATWCTPAGRRCPRS